MQLPECVNFVKKRGCSRSDMTVLSEQSDSWTLHCRTCKLVWVLSKEGVRDKNRFETEMRRRKEQEQLERARSRRKIFV